MKNKFFVLKIVLLCIISIKDILSQDFQVSYKGTVGFWPNIVADSVGNFVVVWDDSRNVKGIYGGTGSDGDIYGQRYNHKGIPIGGNFRISDDSISSDISFAGQHFVRSSMNKRGEYVVTWEDTRPKGTPPDPTLPLEFNIYAQLFDINNNPIGTNFLVNDTYTSGQLNPDVIVRNDGSFLIIWVNTLDNKRINLQSFDSTGKRVGLNQKLNLKGEQPRMALFNNGNYIIIADSIAQLFSFPYTPISEPFHITSGFNKEIKISDDDLIYIVFQKDRMIYTNYLDSDIYLEVYNPIDKSLINRIKVNDDNTDYWQVQPTMSINDSHVFIAWQDYRNGYQIGDGNCVDIYGQRYNLNLLQIGPNFKVSHETNESGQIYPTTVLCHDSIYIAWFDNRSMEYFPVYPPSYKQDVWATIQDFNNPTEGNPIHCVPPSSEPPSTFKIFQSFPNPTQRLNTIIYDLPEKAFIKLSIYDILGKEVKILVNEYQNAGSYIKDSMYDELPSGVYFAKIIAETLSGNIMTGIVKIVLIK